MRELAAKSIFLITALSAQTFVLWSQEDMSYSSDFASFVVLGNDSGFLIGCFFPICKMGVMTSL